MLGKTRGQMLKEMGSSELTEWIAYSRLEPIGIPGFDYSKVKVPDNLPMSPEKQISFFKNMVDMFAKRKNK